ncbi:hypothetical protein [Nostoc sp. CALU 546]
MSNSEDFNFRQFLPQVTVQNASKLVLPQKHALVAVNQLFSYKHTDRP